jgi:hypothetical protein
MKRGLTGHYLTISTVGETCRAFVPDPLPRSRMCNLKPSTRFWMATDAWAVC